MWEINCPNCSQSLPETSLYCDQCSQPVGRRCDDCQGSNRASAVFCRHCGKPLSASPSAHPIARDLGSDLGLGRFRDPTEIPQVISPNSEHRHEVVPTDDTSQLETPTDLIDHHRHALEEYVGAWFDQEIREELEISIAEAAYHACLHASALYRLTGQERVLAGLREFSETDRLRLSRAASKYVEQLDIATPTEVMLRDDGLSIEALEELEDLLLKRAEMEHVIEIIKMLSQTLTEEQTDSFRSSLAMAIAEVAHFDDLLDERPDVKSVLGEPLRACQACFVVPVESAWFDSFGEPVTDFDFPAIPSDESFLAFTAASAVATNPPVASMMPSIALPPTVRSAPEAQFSLAAAVRGVAAKSVYLKTSESGIARALLLIVHDGIYQISMLDPVTSRNTNQWDGFEIVGVANNAEVARQTIRESEP